MWGLVVLTAVSYNYTHTIPAVGLINLEIIFMKKVIAFGVAFLPMLASAQVIAQQNLTGIVDFIRVIMNVATGLIMAAATLWFLWGVFEFVKAAGNEEERAKGRAKIVAGIIGLAVMASVWGLVRWVTGTTGTAGGTALPAPVLPTF